MVPEATRGRRWGEERVRLRLAKAERRAKRVEVLWDEIDVECWMRPLDARVRARLGRDAGGESGGKESEVESDEARVVPEPRREAGGESVGKESEVESGEARVVPEPRWSLFGNRRLEARSFESETGGEEGGKESDVES
jgi:hypothetical protein